MNKSFSLPLLLSFFSFTMSLMILYKHTLITLEFNFLNMFHFPITLSMILDWSTLMFMSTVLFITSMIMLFSNNYIPQQETNRFITILLLFMISMMLLIMSNNPITLILGWDGLGLSSYILVAYYQNFSTSSSSTLTIMSNRMGDVAIMITISITLMTPNNFIMNMLYPKISTILILFAALTKSAQFPFSAWLPAAMAAPTPISALVHSSTLVTAGMFLLLRTNSYFHPNLSFILLIVSSFTMLMAGLTANWEQDLKKIIALSTLSQVAMMMFSISINAPHFAFFHLITHAMFKSTMFMCAGIFISSSTYQDLRKTIYFKSLPIPSISFGISSMALMGIPFSSGFYSKHLITEHTLSNYFWLPSVIMILSIGLTMCYSLRLMTLAMKNFMKTNPDTSLSNVSMNLPIAIMTPMSIILGSTLSWIMLPEQMFLLSPLQKLLTTIPLLMGILLNMSLHYKNITYLKMGEMSISLWYSHFLSTHTFQVFNNTNIYNLKTDKLWLELFGPQGIHSMIKTHSKTINKNNMSMMLMIIITLILLTTWL